MFILIAFLLGWAHAMILEPTYQAADALGYHVVGELDFKPGSTEPDPTQIRTSIQEIGEMCPRTQAYDRHVSSFTHLILIAWSDAEFPSIHIKHQPVRYQQLAYARAKSVAGKIRRHVPSLASVEIVNMATRKPHPVRVAEEARIQTRKYDVKMALEIAGAAPSDQLGMGLFGEYGQRSKVLVWVDCKESFGKRRPNAVPSFQLAQLGHIVF